MVLGKKINCSNKCVCHGGLDMKCQHVSSPSWFPVFSVISGNYHRLIFCFNKSNWIKLIKFMCCLQTIFCKFSCFHNILTGHIWMFFVLTYVWCQKGKYNSILMALNSTCFYFFKEWTLWTLYSICMWRNILEIL